ncbi:MAG: NTP transferase domain-containing protein [Humidesulfovibrio sp.]|uniref:cytidylyltransferase domain-containing protein n=1 Tax=Humidesulfovibrio sp. TaxID=2910988 RepID=UPI0027F2B700|nr:NTP transferase domain-containing protein [Humidesulfovibrio sp.]MDQ7834242.1 NTP transferase domain-containing protein [Humidesulfovibrio sp.]
MSASGPIIAIVQARMSSSRLPGKSLALIQGNPLLAYLFENLKLSASLDAVVLATSSAPSDDPLAALASRHGVQAVRGDLMDVSARFLRAIIAHPCQAFVRICGDSPLLDPRLVDEAITLYRQGGADLVTNVLRRTYPKGQSVEVINTQAFRRAEAAMTDPMDREHVTRYFYTRADEYRIRSFESGGKFGAVNFCVDTAEDLERISALIARFVPGARRPSWRELVAMEGYE